MPTAQDVAWFKSQFQQAIVPALAGTPFSVDMVTAVACQETGAIWSVLRRKGLSTERILQLVRRRHDRRHGHGRSARLSARTRRELIAWPTVRGCSTWRARGSSTWPATSPATAARRRGPTSSATASASSSSTCSSSAPIPSTSSSGTTPTSASRCGDCVGELSAALKRIGWGGKTALDDHEMAGVAIAYNTGRYHPAKGLKQGYFDGSKFYGENFFGYLQLAHSVQVPLAVSAAVALTRGSRRRAAPSRTGATRAAPTGTAAKKNTARKATATKAVAKNSRPKKPATKSTAKRAASKKPAARVSRPSAS